MADAPQPRTTSVHFEHPQSFRLAPDQWLKVATAFAVPLVLAGVAFGVVQAGVTDNARANRRQDAQIERTNALMLETAKELGEVRGELHGHIRSDSP